MQFIHESVEIPAPVDTVWELVGRPEALAEWHPAVESSDVEGAVRRVEIAADGGSIVENILEHSDEARTYTYEIVESPLGFVAHMSTILAEAVPGGTRVVWEAEFAAADPAHEEELVPVLAGLYAQGLAALRERLLASV